MEYQDVAIKDTGVPIASTRIFQHLLKTGAFAARMVELSRARLDFLASQDEDWWLAVVHFFDVQRERIWILWRRILHTAHHRAQLGVYLRLLNKKVPSVYGPTADVRWEGSDPTSSVAAAQRK
jgi:uncharacterized damage-inducible protein DinB